MHRRALRTADATPVHEAMIRGRRSRVGHHEGVLKTIEVGDLHRDSTEMITDVLEGVQYLLMVDGREVAEEMTSVRSGKSTPAVAAIVSRGTSWHRIENGSHMPYSPGSFIFASTARIGAATSPATMSPMTTYRPTSRSNCRPRRGAACVRPSAESDGPRG
jgi:hypothetical protein